MTFLIPGLAFATLICFLISLKRMDSFKSELIERIGYARLKRLGNMLFITPTVAIVIVVSFYFAIWRSNPLLRFTHMIWILGLWMLATLAFFTFMLPARTKLIYPYLALMASILSIAIAIYFTPLPNFATVFVTTPDLIMPMAIGIANLGLSWAVVYYIRATS